ncbi:IS630 transposase-related protein [Candidatus Albibeggiatoa sp. nov. BB20]|uniref:IS630 transposase-related protein n=1 Tax=Candidatus Albibeggiatoa sp. nov. BB20 TaxID=3162723 RepID=UPI0033655307
MDQSHSEEIRERALEYVEKGDKVKQACKIFKVSRMSLHRCRDMLKTKHDAARLDCIPTKLVGTRQYCQRKYQ